MDYLYFKKIIFHTTRFFKKNLFKNVTAVHTVARYVNYERCGKVKHYLPFEASLLQWGVMCVWLYVWRLE